MNFKSREFIAEKVFPGVSKDLFWKVLSDTDHLNQIMGLPEIRFSKSTSWSEGGLKHAEARGPLGIRIRWVEHPFEWQTGKTYRVRRVFENGPFAQVYGGVELESTGSNSVRLRVVTEITPRNFLGVLLAATFSGSMTRRLLKVCARLKDSISGPAKEFQIKSSELDHRLEQVQGVAPDLKEKLRTYLAASTDRDVLEMRPYGLARAWGSDKKEVLHLFLVATKAGVLDLQWKIMCPVCRVGKAQAETLAQVPGEAHCDGCGVNFGANFDRFVELCFNVNPVVRKAQHQTFCSGGPSVTPHIFFQKNLKPGSRTQTQLNLKDDAIRFRVASTGQALSFGPSSKTAGDSQFEIKIKDGAVVGSQPEYQSGSIVFSFVNETKKPVLVVLESMASDPDVVTAAEVTAMQDFRDLFASEVLAPGMEVGIQNVAILFSDLKDSTARYESAGDATAFSHVHRHFEFLKKHIVSHNGVLVKTIGDAVMASFRSPEEGIQSCLEMMRTLDEFNRHNKINPPIELKFGLHSGPAILINANDRLDYFGRTVNIAARVQGESVGGDFVLSQPVFSRPAVQKILNDAGVLNEPFSAALKGIAEKFTLYRLRSYAPAAQSISKLSKAA